MLRTLLVLITITFSLNSYAEVCEGFNACAELYTKLTGEKLKIDKNISDEMTLAYTSSNLTAENAKTEFPLFLNKNGVALMPKGKVIAMRNGEYLSAPIFVVSKDNMPSLFSKEGLVTFVYHAYGDTKKAVSSKARSYLTKKKNKSRQNIVEFSDSKIITVSDNVEAATKIMKEIFKADK